MDNKLQTHTEANRKVGWAFQAHTQFSNPIFEDGFWVSSVESSCCTSVLGSYSGGDSISVMGLEPIFVSPSEP